MQQYFDPAISSQMLPSAVAAGDCVAAILAHGPARHRAGRQVISCPPYMRELARSRSAIRQRSNRLWSADSVRRLMALSWTVIGRRRTALLRSHR